MLETERFSHDKYIILPFFIYQILTKKSKRRKNALEHDLSLATADSLVQSGNN